MTEENKQLLEILRCSLWENVKRDEEIPQPIRAELCNQTVEGLTAIAYPDKDNLKYSMTSWFAQMIHMQSEAIQQLQNVGIPVVVIKGTAAGIYYPYPHLRSYGDIDLLVQPEHYHDAVEVLCAANWQQKGEIGHYHTAFHKNEQMIELHQCPPGLDDVKEGVYIRQYLLSGFSEIGEGIIRQPSCTFPMFSWQQNGLELIWHFREHLYNGIGLRHAIDWMMFVNSCLDDYAFQQFSPVLEQAGLLTLAMTATKMCQLYLGLPKTITWCVSVDDSLCADLMDFIFDQGNFGQKRKDDKEIKVLSRYRKPFEFLARMQKKGLREWPAARKYSFLRPFAWLEVGARGGKMLLTSSGREKFKRTRDESNRRKALLDQLYGDKTK